jgi:hypothetical protein
MVMKRFLAIIFAFLMAIGFVGCAEYRYADSTNGGTNATKPDDTTTDNSGDDATDDN